VGIRVLRSGRVLLSRTCELCWVVDRHAGPGSGLAYVGGGDRGRVEVLAGVGRHRRRHGVVGRSASWSGNEPHEERSSRRRRPCPGTRLRSGVVTPLVLGGPHPGRICAYLLSRSSAGHIRPPISFARGNLGSALASVDGLHRHPGQGPRAFTVSLNREWDVRHVRLRRRSCPSAAMSPLRRPWLDHWSAEAAA